MKRPPSLLTLPLILLAAPITQAQELPPRLGLAAFFTQPSGAAGSYYSSGWKLNFTVHFRREETIEGRLRLEFGEFSQGKEVVEYASASRSKAQTRLVSYDWLIPLGPKRPIGVDLVLGIGGAHSYRSMSTYYLQGDPNPYRYTDDKVSFAATVGLRLRAARNVEVELHQVLTSAPGWSHDVEDGIASHTALGVCFRF